MRGHDNLVGKATRDEGRCWTFGISPSRRSSFNSTGGKRTFSKHLACATVSTLHRTRRGYRHGQHRKTYQSLLWGDSDMSEFLQDAK
jgi:hypothetical protein